MDNNTPAMSLVNGGIGNILGELLQKAGANNTPAMSLVNGEIGNSQGDELPHEAIKSASKVLNKYYDKHAEDLANQPGGIDLLHHLVNNSSLNDNPSIGPSKGIFSSASVTPEGNIQEAGLFGGFSGNTTRSLLDNLLKVSEINKNKKQGQSFNTEESIQKMADLNSIIDQKLPGYQVTQTAEGSFVVHPKAAGIMAQMAPEQINSLSDSLINNQIVPSQLPRIQKAQVVAAALSKDPNYSPAQADMEFAANKMGSGAFEKNFNNLDSFHKDFEKNADYLLKLSSKMDRSKIPLLNRAIMAGARSITGDPQATQILQAVNTVGNGYARLQNPTLGGQALSDAARKEATDLINGAQTDAQLRSLLDPKNGSMRIDAQNRIDAAQEIRSRLKNTYTKSGSDKKESASPDYKSYLQAIGK